jgi:similar to spore coat protein
VVQQGLGVHEAMEIHEVLNFKTVCTIKSKMMAGMVQDKDLKELLEQDVQQSTKALQDLTGLLARVVTP